MNIGVFVLESSDFESHEDLLRQAGVDRLVFSFDTAPQILERAWQHFQVFLEFKPFAGGEVENAFGERLEEIRKELSDFRSLRRLRKSCPSAYARQ